MIFESGDENSEPPHSYPFLRGRNHVQALRGGTRGAESVDVVMSVKRERSLPASVRTLSVIGVLVGPSQEKSLSDTAVPILPTPYTPNQTFVSSTPHRRGALGAGNYKSLGCDPRRAVTIYKNGKHTERSARQPSSQIQPGRVRMRTSWFQARSDSRPGQRPVFKLPPTHSRLKSRQKRA